MTVTIENDWAPFILMVLKELSRQDKKWGADRDQHPMEWNSILMEEVGEVARATIEGNDKDNYEKELVEVAAVSLQALKNSVNGTVLFDWKN